VVSNSDRLAGRNAKYAAISASTSGNNTLVAAVTGRKIRILAIVIAGAGTVTATLQSGAAGTAISGALPLVANSSVALPYNPAGWGETAVGALLNLSLSGAVAVTGLLVYSEV